MKKIILIISILIFTLPAKSQTDSTAVAFVSYWSIGDSYDFKVTKTSEQWKEGDLVKERKQEYIANFTVLDSTDTSYTIKWSLENEILNSYQIPEELVDRFSKYAIMDILYTTSEVGDLIEIINWEEISATMKNMFEDIIEVLGKEDNNLKKNLATAMEPLKAAYSSRQGVEELVLKELQYFHFPLGVEFDTTEPLYYDEELPNMFGGNPINGNVKLTFEEIDFENSFCILKQEMVLNQEDTKQMLKGFFEKMNVPKDKIDEMFETAVFEITDNNIYEYYYYPGVPHRIETNRKSIIDIDNSKGKRIDKIIIELIYYED